MINKSRMAFDNRSFQIFTKNRLLTGFEKEKEGLWKGPFSFIQAADTQFGMIEDYVKKKENPGWQEEIVLTKKAIKAVNQMTPKPRFFIVCGDLIHAFPGFGGDQKRRTHITVGIHPLSVLIFGLLLTMSHFSVTLFNLYEGTALRKPQEIDFKKVFSELDPEIPLVCVCGNHDIGDTPTPDSIKSYKNTFGDDYFSFWCGGMMCIVLNSQYFQDPSMVLDNAREQEIWLEEQLSLAKLGAFQHVVVFQHIPWFLFKPDEEKEYFNIDKDLRIKMLKKLQEAGVKIIFCGHYHRNAGGSYENLEVVTTSAVGAQLGTDKSGMRIIRVFSETIKHDYYALEDLPTEINLTSL
ncbi:serine/threonine-protein phosphatase CPPED1-like isoform X2 [Tachypleus tridentatus]|uniref:serine/threonine-protein phosphatase CPPED1-like isoform X2 n=1 Tax=Tachypleus tridentatus TaxID=6853 RepID=UPI003FD044BB